ncbi:tRNA (adenosine(37)-N6)-threonylcarbamoyltransferase complex dimerization subunit type 1 TsaB [Ruania zhangjianzhongii]|uniref:tRNA (adenosine(37)-N6)-threonylcarbamoyltransferase complex dimerization subunit type 1 TsaB n=1 Tax=Ruania zhangjianzhongii TaxID=2603206 RepID=UPI001F3F1162|nr:tRNA (adenosine(37)-N6)-threonylcarbamoyltransferase complex dimerization subunit type 1 TsaB [Ruania zhangjianzhongii]
MTASLTLCLDTSDGVAVALLRAGEEIAGARSEETRRHVETLTPLITACLQQAEADPAQITEVAVGTGPAPFTGLRVGLITARTFAEARGIPAFGVSSLEAIAAAAATPGTEILVATDARRREVYWGRYRRTETGVQTVAGPGVATAAELAAEHTDLIDAGTAVGAGVRLYPESLAPGRDQAAIEAVGGYVVDAATLGRLAQERAAAGAAQPTQALYLRSPDIAPPSRRKRAS